MQSDEVSVVEISYKTTNNDKLEKQIIHIRSINSDKLFFNYDNLSVPKFTTVAGITPLVGIWTTVLEYTFLNVIEFRIIHEKNLKTNLRNFTLFNNPISIYCKP